MQMRILKKMKLTAVTFIGQISILKWVQSYTEENLHNSKITKKQQHI